MLSYRCDLRFDSWVFDGLHASVETFPMGGSFTKKNEMPKFLK